MTAGIRVVMITGDQPPTAAAVARELGIGIDADGRAAEIVHGRDLDGLDAAGWRRIAGVAAVFARVSPKHKLQIVEALQQRDAVVAMTGDGVNDAPALKQADIGVAMGVKGTEVAREAADMVLTDDNFATIVRAVEQGRIVDANITKFIHYLCSCNLAEILIVAVAVLAGGPMPLTALQLLWLNLVTDTFPALAMALDPASPDMMRRRPRDPTEPLLGLRLLALIGWQGILLAAATLAAFVLVRNNHAVDGGVTAAFLTLALAQTAHAFNTRSRRRSVFSRHVFENG
jgi:Ca2+-transporting ATPase